ncbi:hypothetical protein DN524_32985, partial [Burkholderia multivorans]
IPTDPDTRRSRRPGPRTALAARIIGTGLPVLFMLGQIVVAGWFIAPFGTEWSDAVAVSDAVLGWIAVVLPGASPFVAVLVVLVFARPAGLIWWSGVVFTVLAGAFGLWVDVDMLTLDDPLAALGFFFLPAYQ